MSDLAALGMISALGAVNVSLYFFMDNSIESRAEGIVTGVVRGVAVTNEHRRIMLNLRWFGAMAIVIGYFMIVTIAYVLIDRHVNAEEVKLFAYLCAFFAFFAVFGSIGHGIVLYLHFRNTLRQAEAD